MGCMKSCPRCATVAAGASMKCRNCGALLVAPPVSLPPQATATAPAAADRFFAPATVTAVVTPPRQPRTEKLVAKRGAPAVPVLVALLLVACAAVTYAAVRSGSGGAPKAPVVLPPVDESGLPNLADA